MIEKKDNPVCLAMDELITTDAVALRCFKAGIPFPAEWQAHTAKARDIVTGKSAPEILVRPQYPAGT